MIETVAEFECLLHKLNPNDNAFAIQTDELIEQLAEGIAAEVYPAVFTFFEKHPDCDCGVPGALVHLVESYYPNYVAALLQSARDNPSFNSALMMNRILNSNIPDSQRAEMLSMLTSITANESLPNVVREMVTGFIQRQAQRRS